MSLLGKYSRYGNRIFRKEMKSCHHGNITLKKNPDHYINFFRPYFLKYISILHNFGEKN